MLKAEWAKIWPQALANLQEAPCGVGPLTGSELLVRGLTSAVAMNGQKVTVRCYNSETGRYVVQLRDGALEESWSPVLEMLGDIGIRRVKGPLKQLDMGPRPSFEGL